MASIVQQVQGSIVTNYGIGTTAISTSKDNALIAFIGWNYGTSGTYIATPAASVADSAGNLWRQIGITAGGTSATQNTRAAIWATVKAQPVSWISVGLTGYTSAAVWTIAEITGLPQAVSLDFSIGTAGTGTNLSLPWNASGPDIGFMAVATGNGTVTTASIVTGWTGLNRPSAGTGATGCMMLPYWNPAITAGAGTTALVLTSSSTFSYALCTISGTASPPPQYDIRHPLNVIEAAFGASPGNISNSLDYTFSSEFDTWTDISTRVIGGPAQSRASAARGRQYELQQEETGELTVSLDNHDGAFTPTYPDSPYYSNALNLNMSFQRTISPWTTQNGATIGQSAAQSYASGLNAIASFSMTMNGNGSSATPRAISESVAVNVNYAYSASAWIYVQAGYATGCAVVIIWHNSGGGVISTSTGSVTAIPAAAWTQITLLNSTPPAGAATAVIGVQAQGTPSAGTTFFIAEAALVLGNQVTATGQVAVKTPIRMTTWWQGRQWPLWMGYIERWPQAWPEMPQWGFSKAVATDALGIMAAGQMNSALIGEVLADNPVVYLPCNEQYTTATVGATPAQQFLFGTSPIFAPADASGLIALNKAVNNQVTGTYFDGNTQQVSTGLAMNFFGDDGTGMGATGYASESTGLRGPSLLYAGPELPGIETSAGGWSIEFWFTWDGTSAQNVTLLTLYSTPSAFMAPIATTYGAAVSLEINTSVLQIGIGGTFVAILIPAIVPSQSPQQVVLVFTQNSATATVYLNGQSIDTVNAGSFSFQAVVLGPGRYSYDCNNVSVFSAYNYSAGHLAIYNYQLSASRILAHYEAGASGWSGVSAAYRFAQILTWGQLGLKRGGYYTATATGNPEITQIGPAYQLGGATASDAVNAVAQSEGGTYYVKGDGTITYLERVIGYNQPVSATLGDNATAAPDILNANPGFANGSITGWSGTNATLSYSSQMYGQYGSLSAVPTGTVPLTVFSPAGNALSGGTYATGAWVLSPQGGTVTTGLRWTGGSFATSYVIAPSCWNFLSSSGTIPAGAGISSASVFAGAGAVNGTISLLVSYGYYMQQSTEIPFMQDTVFDLDDTYVYNEVTATQVDGPNQLIEYDYRSPVSQQSYFRRSALSFQSLAVSPYDVSDIATWSVTQFAQPVLHATEIRIHASGDPLVIFPVLLTLDAGDIVQVNRRPVGGAIVSELGIIERIQYEIGPRYFYVTLQISPYQPANNVLCADTAGFSTPGTTTLGW